VTTPDCATANDPDIVLLLPSDSTIEPEVNPFESTVNDARSHHGAPGEVARTFIPHDPAMSACA